MPYQFKNVCYSTLTLAQDAWASEIPPSFFAASTGTIYFYPEKIDSEWLMCLHSITNGSANQCFQLNSPPFQSCTDASDPTSQFNQGLELGWAVASVVVVGFVWRYLRLRH